MKKYTLTNYAETNATASSSTTDSGIIDSGVIDSGIVDSGLVDSGVVDPDDEEDTDDENGWDYGSYTEAEMDEMMENGTWNGGYVNGVYVMPTVDIHSNDGGSEENTGRGYTGGGNTNGGNTDGGNTDGGNTDEQNNTVPTPDEQSTSGDSTQNGNQSGGGTPGNSTEETNQTSTIENTSDDSIVQYDVIDKSGFCPQKSNTGCRKACQDMQIKAGYTSSNSQFIPMTVNMNDKPIAVHERFQEGKEYIDSELARGRAVIVGVDYKETQTGNLDHGSDHFVLIVGKYPGIGSEYYHYFDPRTQSIEKGTRSENVLLIENGYLVGDFEDYPGRIFHYVVTRVNYNKDL